jgi:hypothetical protein
VCSYSWRVPPGVWGELKIVPAIEWSGDIGELGINEGTAAAYNWKWYHSMPSMALSVVLALAIVLVRDNRDPRVLLILIPIIVVNLLWSWFQRILGGPSDVIAIFAILVKAFVVGVAVLWLLAYKLGNRNRLVTFLLALLVMAAVGFVGLVSHQAWASPAGFKLVVLQVVAIVTMLLVFAVTGWLCRRRYGPWRFMLWLLLWMVACTLAAFTMFSMFAGGLTDLDRFIQVLPQVLLVGLLFGACMYVLNLPFMILAFCSSFFRERFYAYFHLRSMPMGPHPPAGTRSVQLDEQTTGANSTEES